MKFETKHNNVHSIEWYWKYHLQNCAFLLMYLCVDCLSDHKYAIVATGLPCIHKGQPLRSWLPIFCWQRARSWRKLLSSLVWALAKWDFGPICVHFLLLTIFNVQTLTHTFPWKTHYISLEAGTTMLVCEWLGFWLTGPPVVRAGNSYWSMSSWNGARLAIHRRVEQNVLFTLKSTVLAM